MIPSLLLSALSVVVLARAATYNATFTWYGQGDERGSPNCNTNAAACGFYTSPGFSAAVSQNLYGAGTGKGPYCGKCLRLNPLKDPVNGQNLTGVGKDVIVKINNLCPVQDEAGVENPLCSQLSMTATNKYGASIDVNVCSDSGAKAALFGSSGIGLAVGTAEEVDCNSYNGTTKTSGTGPNQNGTGDSGSGAIGGTKKSDARSWRNSRSLGSVAVGLGYLLALLS